MMIKIIENIRGWCHFPSIKTVLIKGYNIKPLLPAAGSINNFINNIYIKTLRVIGSISIILALSKQYLELPLVLQYVVLCFAFLQFIQITVISLIKTIYLIKKLIFNPEEFEVRNTPPLGGSDNNASGSLINIFKTISGLASGAYGKSLFIICLSVACILGAGFIINLLLHSVNVDSRLFTGNILESSVLGSLSDLRSAIQDGLSGLSSEEICCLFNSIGFFIILTFVFSIITTLMGKKIIDYFNLETKYPKLSKYFKFRAKMDHYYIIFNIFMIVLVSIIYMGINLYMFYTFES